MPGRRLLNSLLFLQGLLLASPGAADPHVWAEAVMIVEAEDHAVQGISLIWRFDALVSALVIRAHDLAANPVLGLDETAAIRAKFIDPLRRLDRVVHLWEGSRKLDDLTVDRFSARVEKGRLLYEFRVSFPPINLPGVAPFAISLFDEERRVGLVLAGRDAVRSRGALPSGCGFRAARGHGARSDHPEIVTIHCGD